MDLLGFQGFQLLPTLMHFGTILILRLLFCQLTFMFVVFGLSLQDSKNAKKSFPLTANHSCWDWVRRRETRT